MSVLIAPQLGWARMAIQSSIAQAAARHIVRIGRSVCHSPSAPGPAPELGMVVR
jgi:hypothetical protein